MSATLSPLAGFAIDHDPRSRELFDFLAAVDYGQCGDHFCWKSGGDGDNGELLMAQLDLWFATQDKQRKG